MAHLQARAANRRSEPLLSRQRSTKASAAELKNGAVRRAEESALIAHIPQVRLLAKNIWGRLRFAVDLDDLIAFGTIGLLGAIQRFDSKRGILLKTYAEHRIRGAILDGLREMDWLPRGARESERRRQQAEQGSGREANIEGNRQSVQAAGQGVKKPCARFMPRIEMIVTGGGLAELERLAETSRQRKRQDLDPEALYERKEQRERLAGAIARLPSRERAILKLYYFGELNMRQIGERLGIHESRVSQLHAAATRALAPSSF